MIVLRERQTRLAIVMDYGVASFAPVLTSYAQSWAETSRTPRRAATVELRRSYGGMGLLGGVKIPAADAGLRVVVPTSGPMQPDFQRTCPGLLGHSLNLGLPDEFAQVVLGGLLSLSSTTGELRVTSAAYDPEQTSWSAMSAIARILSVVLHSEGDEFTEAEEREVRRLMLATNVLSDGA